MIPLNTHEESYDGIRALADLFASLKYPTTVKMYKPYPRHPIHRRDAQMTVATSW